MTSTSTSTAASPPRKKRRARPEPLPGDILLFNRARQWNRIITWFTHSPFYHVAIYKGDHHVVEARPRGVVVRDLRGPDGDRFFVSIEAPGGRAAGLVALSWAEQQVGKKYSKRDVAVLILERVFKTLKLNYTTRDRFSCGELVTCAFQQAGVKLFPHRNPETVVPADFTPLLKG